MLCETLSFFFFVVSFPSLRRQAIYIYVLETIRHTFSFFVIYLSSSTCSSFFISDSSFFFFPVSLAIKDAFARRFFVVVVVPVLGESPTGMMNLFSTILLLVAKLRPLCCSHFVGSN